MCYTVIFLRYSDPNKQTDESLHAQEKVARTVLDQRGIAHHDAIVLREAGLRGDLELASRDAYAQLHRMVRAGQVAILAVDQQGRFSRGLNVESFLTDLVFSGGRFLSRDGVDTNIAGWKQLVGIKQIHNRMEIRDTGSRVRRQTEHIADDSDGCTGDYPHGYTSEFKDPISAAAWKGHGTKPRRRTLIDPTTRGTIRLVFWWYVHRSWSKSKIARELTKMGSKIPPINYVDFGGWRDYHVDGILRNPKYMGKWEYGLTTTIRNSVGKKKFIDSHGFQRISRTARSHLAIVDSHTWDAAQAGLARTKDMYGKNRGLNRGTLIHPSKLYPTSLLSAHIECKVCGRYLHVSGCHNRKKTFSCPKHRWALCSMSSSLDKDAAEKRITGIVRDICTNDSEWMKLTINSMLAELAAQRDVQPQNLASQKLNLQTAEKELQNLLAVIRQGLHSDAVIKDIRRVELQVAQLQREIGEASSITSAMAVPDEAWVKQKLQDFATLLSSQSPDGALVLREVLGKVVAEQVSSPLTKHNYVRLRFRISGFRAIAAILGNELPFSVRQFLSELNKVPGTSEEFIVDFPKNGPRELHGPTIVQMRDAGATWPAIETATGVTKGNAAHIYKQLKRANADPEPDQSTDGPSGLGSHNICRTVTFVAQKPVQSGLR